MKAAVGLDFGTESVRAVLVDLRGREMASAVAKYPRGQIIESLPGSKKKLPPHDALQHPLDWLDSAAKATRAALRSAGNAKVLGVGVDFTSCTMLPAKRDGMPLCLSKEFGAEPLAWPVPARGPSISGVREGGEPARTVVVKQLVNGFASGSRTGTPAEPSGRISRMRFSANLGSLSTLRHDPHSFAGPAPG